MATGGMPDPSSVRSALATEGGSGTTMTYDGRAASVDLQRSEGTTAFVWRPTDGAGEEVQMARWDPAVGVLTIFLLQPLLDARQDRDDSLEPAVDDDRERAALVHPAVRPVPVLGAAVGLLRRDDREQDVILAEPVLGEALAGASGQLDAGVKP